LSFQLSYICPKKGTTPPAGSTDLGFAVAIGGGTGDTYLGGSVALSGHTVAVGDPRGPGPNDTVRITYTYYLP
jgi:hypothetical protein